MIYSGQCYFLQKYSMAVVLLGVFPLATYSQARTSLYLSLSHTFGELHFRRICPSPNSTELHPDTHDQVPATHSSSPTLAVLEKEA